MNPQRFRTRTDLLEYVRKYAPLSGVRRAVNEGRVEACGGFSSLPPHLDPGWIVEVTSKHGKTWTVAIAVNAVAHAYRVLILDRTPWELWDGALDRHNPVYDGDYPERYHERMDLIRAGRPLPVEGNGHRPDATDGT